MIRRLILPALILFGSLAATVFGEKIYVLPKQSATLSSEQVVTSRIPEAISTRNALSIEPANFDERLSRWVVVELEDGTNVDQVLNRLKNDQIIEASEVLPERNIFDSSLDEYPNDPLSIFQWHLDAIEAYAAWDLQSDASGIVIGIPDLGVDLTHPDLEEILWTNEIEVNGSPGVDDDGNGMIDDIHGWDAYDMDGDPSSTGNTHGTHVAGLAAAAHNNGTGVTGVAPNAEIMALRVGANPNFSSGPDLDAIIYAVDNGADVISMSYGGSVSSILESDVMRYAHQNGVVLVAASGNSFASYEHYPAAYEWVISVGATNSGNSMWNQSNYGWWVDVAAPGVNILSTVNEGYGYKTGTSMACPIVAGIAALVMANEPGISPDEVRARLSSSTNPIYNVPDDFVLNGQVSAYRAMLASEPSVALIDLEFDDEDGNGIVEPGETCDIIADLELFGGSAQQVDINLVSFNFAVGGISGVSITDLVQGNFSAGPITATISESADRGSYPLGLAFDIDGNLDTLSFHLPVDPPWRSHQAGNMTLSISEFGAIGYWDYVDGKERPDGVYLEDQPQGYLFHGSVLVRHDNEISDCAYGTVATDRYDFSVEPGGEIRQLESDPDRQIFRAKYSNESLRLTQTSTSFPDDDSFVIIDYMLENMDSDTIDASIAVYCDWDIRIHFQNYVKYVPGERFSYMTGDNGAAGIMSLNDYEIDGVRAVDNEQYVYNGFRDMHKVEFMTEGTTLAEAETPGEYSHLISSKLGRIASGDTVSARFAILAAENENTLLNIVDRVQSVDGELAPRPAGSVNLVPTDFVLHAAYPNPFNSSVRLYIDLPESGQLDVTIFDLLGRDVAELETGNKQAGRHILEWNSSISADNLASGVYFVRATFENRELIQKIILLK